MEHKENFRNMFQFGHRCAKDRICFQFYKEAIFMKTKRTIASILAAVMAFSALPILSVNAADTAMLGDVD